MQMTTETIAPGVVRIVLDGRLDIAGVGTIAARFKAVAGSNTGVVVDLSSVDFLASFGIKTLLSGARAAQLNGGCLVLLNPVDDVQSVLEVTRLTDLMPIYRDGAAAFAAASGLT